jgi:N-acetylneuraminate epimerase
MRSLIQPKTRLGRLVRWTLLAFVIHGSITTLPNLNGDDLLQSAQLAALPDTEGFAGPFAGVCDGRLLVAGGANFPDKMPWEGGTKVWYDRVFVLESPEDQWTEIGKLPRPLGYGVSISTEDGVVCIGGSDANQHFSDCFRIAFQNDKLTTVALPSLPSTCANACGVLWGNKIYIAGGLESPTSTSTLKTFWSLDISDPNAQWKSLEPWPGPARMLATAAIQDDSFFLISGTDLKVGSDGKVVREYLRHAYRYHPTGGWTQIADLPRAAVAAPTPAPALGQSTILMIGGDDGTLVDFDPPEKHPGFPKSILSYDTATDTWRNEGEVPIGHVTTTMVRWKDRFIMPSGEVRPGKRSPKIWAFEKFKE